MPANIQAASPNGVLPQSLCTAFTETREYLQEQANNYHDATIQRGQLAQQSRRRWKLAKRLSGASLATLYAFLSARIGVPFVFYDPYDVTAGAAIGSNYDPTGANTQGQVIVVMRGNWSQTTDVCRTNVGFELEQVA